MLENLSALAIVPKAKAIAARRLSHGDYLELMRKRSGRAAEPSLF
jgi:V/A-type H+-transporting ATPase subunit C